MLVTDVHTLQPIDFLDFVHQISLQLLLAEYGKNVMGVERTIHKRLARPNAFALLHIDVNTAWYRVLFFGAVVGDHVHLALSLRDLAELDRAIDFADDRSFARLPGFE